MEKSGILQMSGLYGQFQTTMDTKGRFALPAKLRNVNDLEGNSLLEGNLVLTKGLEGCLSLYPEAEWDDIQSKLNYSI